jgi:hypothetical protein
MFACYLWVGIASLHGRETRSHASLSIVVLTLILYLVHTLGIVLLTCRYVTSVRAIHVAELTLTKWKSLTFVI